MTKSAEPKYTNLSLSSGATFELGGSTLSAEGKETVLELNDEHWQVIHFIRDFHEKHGVQAPVRDMIKHFKKTWGKEKGSSRYLHQIFPKGGPQKQGNRFAGVRKPKGEH